MPDWVGEAVDREVAKQPHLYNEAARERLLCDLTLQHDFEAAGYEVLYRGTPAGPKVVAAGAHERLVVQRGRPEEEQLLSIWVP